MNASSDEVNAYIKAGAGDDYSAKDFRTWSATVLAAATLAGADRVPPSRAGRKRAVVSAVAVVAEQLGNTPAVCRSSYVDPRILDRFESGETIAAALGPVGGSVDLGISGGRRALEEAVIALIDDDAATEQVAV